MVQIEKYLSISKMENLKTNVKKDHTLPYLHIGTFQGHYVKQ